MSPVRLDEDEPPHPHETLALFGHSAAEQTLLTAYRSCRIPHAWLFGGESGIGKATLAFRLARFVLAYPDPSMPGAQSASSLELAANHPTVRRVAGRAHSDLLTIERVINEKTGKLYTEIRVEDVRQLVPFFGSTAGEGGWRIAIVDSVDELNRASENALLKVLEEPPPRSLLLLVSHAPGRVLPTIRSRCRTLLLRPLDVADVAKATAAALGKSEITDDIHAAAGVSGGSVSRALMFLEGDTLDLHRQITIALERLPELDPRELHALGDMIAGTAMETLATFMDTINAWLGDCLKNGPQQTKRLARVANVWTEVNRAGRETEAYNLDRKPFVFSVFGQLAEAARS